MSVEAFRRSQIGSWPAKLGERGRLPLGGYGASGRPFPGLLRRVPPSAWRAPGRCWRAASQPANESRTHTFLNHTRSAHSAACWLA